MTTNNNNSIEIGEVTDNKDNEKDNPFAEYMWMGEEDEFNKQALEQIREDDFIERCFEEMLEEEEMGMFVPPPVHPQQQHEMDAGIELINNLNFLSVHENVAIQGVEEDLTSSEHGEEEECNHNDASGGNCDHDNDNQGIEAIENNLEDSLSDTDADSDSDAPQR